MSNVDEIAKQIVNEVLLCKCAECRRDRNAFSSRIATALSYLKPLPG